MKEDFDFAAMGEQIARAMGEGPSADRMLAQRARLVEWERRRSRAAQRQLMWWRGAFALASVCAVLVGVWFLGGFDDAELTAEFDGRPIVVDEWVNATQQPARLSFSDDSSIVLAQGASARIKAIGEPGLSLTLEQGRLDAQITPGGEYHWTIHAGPYQVRVIGTVFAVQWQPEDERLRVAVTRGKVRVSGGAADEHERELVAGDSLTLALAAERAETTAVPTPEPTVALDVTEDSRASSDAEEATALVEAPGPARAKPSRGTSSRGGSNDSDQLPDEPPTSLKQQPPPEGASDGEADDPSSTVAAGAWRQLAKSGRYGEAVSAARAEGMGALLDSSSASDLLLLADAARLGGDASVAKQALLRIRSRFPGHPNASVAAFSLGRLASEVQGDQREAIKWFRKYLASGATGALAEGARGRLLMAYLQLGDRASARKAAKEYLQHHPKGRHATVARSLLD
jgi:hypothetical protein